MTAADDRAFDTDLLDTLSTRVMVGDGAMGTQLQAADLTLDDFNNLEGCNEILNDTRPDVIETIHRNYFEAGADAVETNTFGCNLSNLGDYDIADRIRDLSERAPRSRGGSPTRWAPPTAARYVLGSMGPGTKLPTLGHTEYALIRDAYAEAALGMLDGGADADPGRDLPGPAAAEGRGAGIAPGDGRSSAATSRSSPTSRSRPPAPCCWAARSVRR